MKKLEHPTTHSPLAMPWRFGMDEKLASWLPQSDNVDAPRAATHERLANGFDDPDGDWDGDAEFWDEGVEFWNDDAACGF